MSIFNPYVLLGIILAVVGAFGGGYWKGGHDESVKQQLEIARLNAEARKTEQVLVTAVNSQATQLQKANQNAKLLQQKLNADIDSGAVKLRVPVTTTCPVPTTPDAPVAPGNSNQASAELDREVAKALVGITDQGDANTRQLNACIDAYNTVLQTLNKGKP